MSASQIIVDKIDVLTLINSGLFSEAANKIRELEIGYAVSPGGENAQMLDWLTNIFSLTGGAFETEESTCLQF